MKKPLLNTYTYRIHPNARVESAVRRIQPFLLQRNAFQPEQLKHAAKSEIKTNKTIIIAKQNAAQVSGDNITALISMYECTALE